MLVCMGISGEFQLVRICYSGTLSGGLVSHVVGEEALKIKQDKRLDICLSVHSRSISIPIFCQKRAAMVV